MFSTEVQLKVCNVLYPVRKGESKVFDGGLTKIMDCIVPIRDSMVFDRGQTKYMHIIVPRESAVVESRVFLEVFTEYMDCIVPCESLVVDGFRRGLTKSVYCIVLGQSLGSRGCPTGV